MTDTEVLTAVMNPNRLAALRDLGLLDTPAEAAFDRLAQLARKILKTPVALVTLVDDSRQFFKSCLGLPAPWNEWRQSPLSHSFCKHVVANNEPLLVEDARTDPIWREISAVKEWGVVAYLGVPLLLHDRNREVVGSFCVVDFQPRRWTEDEVRIMRDLAASVITEIGLRSEVRRHQAALDEICQLNERLKQTALELEEANRDLEAFNHTVSHDLQNPLRHAQMFSELLALAAASKLDAQSLDYLQNIQSAVQSMGQILAGLLVLSRVSRAKIQREPVDLSQLAQAILDRLASTDPQRRVKTLVQPGLAANADPTLMRVLLENLLGNAWKFTSKKSDAQVEFGAEQRDGDAVYYVRDNGAGFDMAQAGRLFKPFQRLHSASEFEGSGIGLLTARRILLRHGGQIWADAKPQTGATFNFTLPDGKAAPAP